MSDLKKQIAEAVSKISAQKQLKAELFDFDKLPKGTPIREFGPVPVKSSIDAAAEQIVAVHGALCAGRPLHYAIVEASVTKEGGKTMLRLRVAVSDTRSDAEKAKAAGDNAKNVAAASEKIDADPVKKGKDGGEAKS